MSSLVSKAGPESEWGSDSRIAAVRRWHEKSVASRHDQSVLLLDGADLRPGLRVLDLACGAGRRLWRRPDGWVLAGTSWARTPRRPCFLWPESTRRRRGSRTRSSASRTPAPFRSKTGALTG